MTNSIRPAALVISLIFCSLAVAFGMLKAVVHTAWSLELPGTYCTSEADCAAQGYRIDYETGYAVPAAECSSDLDCARFGVESYGVTAEKIALAGGR